MFTRAEISDAVRVACHDWVDQYAANDLSVKSLLLGCEQRLCELLGMNRPIRPDTVDHVAFGNGRHCGYVAHLRLAKKLGGGAPSQ